MVDNLGGRDDHQTVIRAEDQFALLADPPAVLAIDVAQRRGGEKEVLEGVCGGVEAGDTILGGNPQHPVAILHNRLHHIVHQTVAAVKVGEL